MADRQQNSPYFSARTLIEMQRPKKFWNEQENYECDLTFIFIRVLSHILQKGICIMVFFSIWYFIFFPLVVHFIIIFLS